MLLFTPTLSHAHHAVWTLYQKGAQDDHRVSSIPGKILRHYIATFCIICHNTYGILVKFLVGNGRNHVIMKTSKPRESSKDYSSRQLSARSATCFCMSCTGCILKICMHAKFSTQALSKLSMYRFMLHTVLSRETVYFCSSSNPPIWLVPWFVGSSCNCPPFKMHCVVTCGISLWVDCTCLVSLARLSHERATNASTSSVNSLIKLTYRHMNEHLSPQKH